MRVCVQDWATLNASISGRLMAVKPAGYACVAYGLSSPQCSAVFTHFQDPVWRADQAGAMQYPEWEGEGDNNCYDGVHCAQGTVPPFGVRVSNATDVAVALAFAQQHNIRVVVRCTAPPCTAPYDATPRQRLHMYGEGGGRLNRACRAPYPQVQRWLRPGPCPPHPMRRPPSCTH
jgi:hypothetical protein